MKTNVALIVGGWLLEHGCPTNTKGFSHLKDCIVLAINNPTEAQSVQKFLYDSIAVRENTTKQCVDRNIRTVLDMWWPKLSQYPYFMEEPTNKELILRLTEIIRAEVARADNNRRPRPSMNHISIYERVFNP